MAFLVKTAVSLVALFVSVMCVLMLLKIFL